MTRNDMRRSEGLNMKRGITRLGCIVLVGLLSMSAGCGRKKNQVEKLEAKPIEKQIEKETKKPELQSVEQSGLQAGEQSEIQGADTHDKPQEFDYEKMARMIYDWCEESITSVVSDDADPHMERKLPAVSESVWSDADDDFLTAIACFYGSPETSCDEKRAEELLQACVERGNADAYYFLSLIALNRREYGTALEMAKLAMEGDSPYGYLQMGRLLLDYEYYLAQEADEYDDEAHNEQLAMSYFEQAIDMGLEDAYYGLGRIHERNAYHEDHEYTLSAGEYPIDRDYFRNELYLAREYFEKATNGILPEIAANSYDCMEWGAWYLHEDDYQTVVCSYRDLAYKVYAYMGEYGNAYAWFEAGSICGGGYAYGALTLCAPELYVDCLRNAYEIGNAYATERLNVLQEEADEYSEEE